MTGRIPQEFIDDLISRVDIVDIVDHYVPLKKAGKNFVGLCPFHTEKSPSFTVSQDKQFYHCFGCGAHGTAIGFLMDYDHLDFIEALKELASNVGMELPQQQTTHSQPSTKTDHSDLYASLDQACQYFQKELKHHTEAKEAIKYLKNRGITGKTAARFRIGYAPAGWNNLNHVFGSSPQDNETLEKCGLVIKKESAGYYDRFRQRIMFPIINHRGKLVGFGGRVIDDSLPKYLNSPETPVFIKGQTLYGLHQARHNKTPIKRFLVVEGYMDVIMLAQHEINYAVATLGTATSREHLTQLFRTAPEIVFCFDGDQAGKTAAWRALETVIPLLKQGRQAKFLFLPDGEDPDSMVQKEGKAQFESRVDTCLSMTEFLFNHLGKMANLSQMDGRARLIELAMPIINNIPDGVLKEMVKTKLSEKAQVSPSLLDSPNLKSASHRPNRNFANSVKNTQKTPPSLVRQAITCLLHMPSLAEKVEHPNQFKTLDEAGIQLLVDIIELLKERPHLNAGALLEHWRGQKQTKHLQTLLKQDFIVPETGLETEFDHIIDRLCQLASDARYHQLCAIPSKQLSRHEKTELQNILNKKT